MAVSSENGGTVDGVRIFNNILVNNKERGLAVTGWDKNGPRKNVFIHNNVIAQNGVAGSYGGGLNVEGNAQVSNISIRNNIVSNNSGFQILATTPGVVVDLNLIDGYQGAWGETKGLNPIEGSPQFLNPAGGLFAVPPSSPAVDRAASAYAPAVDFQGVSRPLGTAPDLGAYEWDPSCPVP